jgi:hypothetical protein
VSAVDKSGRVADSSIIRILGWSAGTRQPVGRELLPRVEAVDERTPRVVRIAAEQAARRLGGAVGGPAADSPEQLRFSDVDAQHLSTA